MEITTKKRFYWALLLIVLSVLLTACTDAPIPSTDEATPAYPTEEIDQPAPTEPQLTALQPLEPTEIPTEEPSQPTSAPTEQGTQPTNTALPGPISTLAFLQDGNLWLIEFPTGEPIQLTTNHDIYSYAWAPDGTKLGYYNGREFCQLTLEDVSQGCIPLDLNDLQASIHREISWSPDMNKIVLWNPINPFDEDAIGWIIANLDDASEVIKIFDPVDWGAQLSPDNEPGGGTGQALFLADGALVGTISHRWLCGDTGCHYQLFTFNFDEGVLQPYPNKPEEGFSEGMGLVLSQDGLVLFNFGTFRSSCEAYLTFMDAYELNTNNRQLYTLEQEAVNGLAISPNASQAVISRNAGCSTENQTQWAQTCGLSQGFDVYNLQQWRLSENQRNDLLPGLQPGWSSNAAYLAFRSCLVGDNPNGWQTSGDATPTIYVMIFNDGSVFPVSIGENPQWQP